MTGGSEPAGLNMSLDALIKKGSHDTRSEDTRGRGRGGRSVGGRGNSLGVRDGGVAKPVDRDRTPEAGRGGHGGRGGRFDGGGRGGYGGSRVQGGRGGRFEPGGGYVPSAGRLGGNIAQSPAMAMAGPGIAMTGPGSNMVLAEMHAMLRQQQEMIRIQAQQMAELKAAQMMGAMQPAGFMGRAPMGMAGGMHMAQPPPVNKRAVRELAVPPEPEVEDIAQLACEQVEDGSVIVTYEGTPIVTVSEDGSVTLSTGGWWVRETVAGMNRALLPIGMSVVVDGEPEDGAWRVKEGTRLLRFTDDMTIPPRGPSGDRAMLVYQSICKVPARVAGRLGPSRIVEAPDAAAARRMRTQGRY